VADETVLLDSSAFAAAVAAYSGVDGDREFPLSQGQSDIWKRVAELAGSKAVTKLCEEVERLDPSDSVASTAKVITAGLARLKDMATARAEHYRPRSRADQFRSRIYSIYEASYGSPGASEGGPYARFHEEATRRAFGRPDGPRAIKFFVQQERIRRRILMAGNSLLIAHATGVRSE
jgi:hypothetical protein